MSSLIKLNCGYTNNYWGKLGGDSLVARLLAGLDQNVELKSCIPYGELWIGVHPSAPSVDVSSGKMLSEILHGSNRDTAEHSDLALPLLKVLSIKSALCLQLHPDRPLAEQLHVKYPSRYPDKNHKPEMAISLTDFEFLCGFRPAIEIFASLSQLPILRKVVGEEATNKMQIAARKCEPGYSEENQQAIQFAFQRLLETDDTTMRSAVKELFDIAQKSEQKSTQGCNFITDMKMPMRTFLKLYHDYPEDIGIFSIFFLNYFHLKPGEAVFIPPNQIHAYLSGDLIECMATSANVVRGAFTSKHKDPSLLARIARYDAGPHISHLVHPIKYIKATLNGPLNSESTCILYRPPTPEFMVMQLRLEGQNATAHFTSIESHWLLICTQGAGYITVKSSSGLEEGILQFGSVFSVRRGADITFTQAKDTSQPIVIFIASDGLEY